MNSDQHLHALDALRGFAVLVVFLSHASNDGLLPGWLGDGAGQMGVQLFFLLSGYLMFHCYGTQTANAQNLRKFALGRFSRIAPLYWLVLLLSLLVASTGITPHYSFTSTGEFLRAFLFGAATKELWSVPVEVQFYCIFAGIWLARAFFSRNIFQTIAIGFAVAIIWRGWVSETDIVLPYMPLFLIGILIRLRQNHFAGLISWTGSPLAALICLGFFILNLPGIRGAAGLELTDGFYPKLWLDPIRLTAVCLIFISALSGSRNIWRIPTGLAFLGQISFCVYLIHRPILEFALSLDPSLPGPIVALICFGACLGVAQISLIWFERPIQRAIKASRVWARPQAPQATPG